MLYDMIIRNSEKYINQQSAMDLLGKHGGRGMNKQPEVTEKTKQKLADAFCQLYQQKPIEKISIKEIADNAGYNRSTFYMYFIDIYDLLDYVETDLINEMSIEIGQPDISQMSPDKLSQFFKAKSIRLKAVLGDYGNFRFLKRIKKNILIDERLEQLYIPAEEKPYYIEFHLSTSLSLFRLWLNRGMDISEEELFNLIHRLYVEGITTGIHSKADS